MSSTTGGGSAYKLHVDGFHEAKLRSDDVRLRLRDVKALVNLAKNALKARSTQHTTWMG